MRDFHNRYGNVVRYGPSQVSFISAEAWKDIYGHGHRQLPKDITKDVSKTPDILNAGDADHAKFRKALSHGFSERSLRAQEPLIKGYVDLLIKKLQDLVASNQPIDMVKWYNLTTFDIIGDLAFGESFGGLETSTYHFWVKNMFNALKLIPFINLAQSYPLVSRAFNIMMPNSVQDKADEQRRFAREKAMKRMHRTGGNYRHDFMDSMLKHRGDKDGLSDDEIVSNSNVLIIAGSETTATLLSGVTYWLLRTPEVLEKVTQEVRSSFDTEDEITFTTTSSKLPYMTACLTEALRMYPPVPSNLPRRTPRDAVTCIAGINIPPGVSWISCHSITIILTKMDRHPSQSIIRQHIGLQSTSISRDPFHQKDGCPQQRRIPHPLSTMTIALLFSLLALVHGTVSVETSQIMRCVSSWLEYYGILISS
jgi:cytochrome P450